MSNHFLFSAQCVTAPLRVLQGDYDGKALEKWSKDDREKDVKILNECINI